MIDDNDNPNENLINNDLNINDKTEGLNTEKTETKSNSENDNEVNYSETKQCINDSKEIVNNSIYNMEKKNNEVVEDDDEIIVDDIKESDRPDFIKSKKKKKIKIEIESDKKIYFEGDSDLNTQVERKKTFKKNNHMYHKFINEEILKKITLIIIILYIIIAISSVVVFLSPIRTDYKDSYPFLFCFEFIERFPGKSQDIPYDTIYFMTDINSFSIIHIVFLACFLSVSYFLIRGTKSEISNFFDDISIFLDLTLIFNTPILFMGMFTETYYENLWRPIIYLIFTFISFLCMTKIFIVAKRHKYRNILHLINVSILPSFMTAYQCYCFIYCICYFIMSIFENNGIDSNLFIIEIFAGFIYFCIGVVVMTIFKDIFFIIAMVNIETGLLYSKKKDDYCLTLALFNVGIVSLNFASIISLIFAYNKKIFRLKKAQ